MPPKSMADTGGLLGKIGIFISRNHLMTCAQDGVVKLSPDKIKITTAGR